MKKWIGLVILIFIVVGFLLLKDINLAEMQGYLLQMNIWYFLAGFVCCFATFLIGNWRFKFISKKSLPKSDFFYLLKVLLAGSFLNISTPGAGIGGEPIKAYFLSRKYKKSKSRVFGIIFADKFFQLLVFALFLIFSILFVLYYINIDENLRMILKFILFAVLFVALLFFITLSKRFSFNINFLVRQFYRLWFIKNNFLSADEFQSYVKKKFNIFLNFFKDLIKDKNIIFVGVLLSVIYWIFYYLVSWILFLSFGAHVSFLVVVIAVSLATFVGEISISPGGVGISEGSMFLLYSAMGINSSLALIVSLVSKLIYYFFSLVLGGISLINLKYITK